MYRDTPLTIAVKRRKDNTEPTRSQWLFARFRDHFARSWISLPSPGLARQSVRGLVRLGYSDHRDYSSIWRDCCLFTISRWGPWSLEIMGKNRTSSGASSEKLGQFLSTLVCALVSPFARDVVIALFPVIWHREEWKLGPSAIEGPGACCQHSGRPRALPGVGALPYDQVGVFLSCPPRKGVLQAFFDPSTKNDSIRNRKRTFCNKGLILSRKFTGAPKRHRVNINMLLFDGVTTLKAVPEPEILTRAVRRATPTFL